MKKILILGVVLVIGGYVGGYLVKTNRISLPKASQGVVDNTNQVQEDTSNSLQTDAEVTPAEETTMIHAAFNLVDQDGNAVTQSDFAGKKMLVYFGFTNCPDICPTDLAVISDALNSMDEQQKSTIVPIFITVDPERDTPEVMKSYLANFNSAFKGLSGDAQSIDSAKKAFAVFSSKTENESGEAEVNHSAYIYLMDENGQYVKHFNHGITAEALKEGLN